MPIVDSPPLPTTLVETIEERLRDAPAPLNFKAVVKGLKVPKRKPAQLQAEMREHLDDLIRTGRFFTSPSGKAGEIRYWNKDEKQFLREAVLEKATTPATLADLGKSLKEASAGADAKYVESLIRELIGEEQLFEHPPLKGKTPRFGASQPPPPIPALEREANRKAVEKLINDCLKFLTKTGANGAELVRLLKKRLGFGVSGDDGPPPETRQATTDFSPSAHSPDPSKIQELILKQLEREMIVTVVDLRAEMPSGTSHELFDFAVLDLADQRRVILNQDMDASRFSEADRAKFVRDGASVITTITRGNAP